MDAPQDRRQQLREGMDWLGVDLEDVWISYVAHAGSASTEDLQAWLNGDDRLPGLQVDLLMMALDDLEDREGSKTAYPGRLR